MQNAKDTFYEMLRTRLCSVNPDRTIVVRGVTRPGTLVEENELVTAFHVTDCFRLRWLGVSTDNRGTMPLISMECAIDYETAGSAANGGMDRGRGLAAMDGELLAVLSVSPQSTQKSNYGNFVNTGTVTTMGTRIWWAEPAFGKAEVRQNRISRIATVAVMSYQEAGEL